MSKQTKARGIGVAPDDRTIGRMRGRETNLRVTPTLAVARKRGRSTEKTGWRKHVRHLLSKI